MQLQLHVEFRIPGFLPLQSSKCPCRLNIVQSKPILVVLQNSLGLTTTILLVPVASTFVPPAQRLQKVTVRTLKFVVNAGACLCTHVHITFRATEHALSHLQVGCLELRHVLMRC